MRMRKFSDGSSTTSINCCTLFVNSANGQTYTLRDLPVTLDLAELKAKLELMTGYPSNAYTLHYGEKEFQHGREAVFDLVNQNGSVVKMVVKEELRDLYRSINEGKLEAILKECLKDDKMKDEKEVKKHPTERTDEISSLLAEKSHDVFFTKTENKYNVNRIFLAVFKLAFEGKHTLLKGLINKEPTVLSTKTEFGRNLVHAAAVSDNPIVLQNILLLCLKHKIQSIFPQDCFYRTPADVTLEHNAFLCDRLIREFKHFKRSGMSSGTHFTDDESDEDDDENDTSGKHSHTKGGKKVNFAKKNRAKSAVVRKTYDRSASVLSRASTNDLSRIHSPTLKKYWSTDVQSETSGYQTEENIPEMFKTYKYPTKYEGILVAKKEVNKKVKFNTRVKSAPIVSSAEATKRLASTKQTKIHTINNSQVSEDMRQMHTKCYEKKPFLAFRDVPFQELKKQTVEFVPLRSTKVVGMDARSREKSVMSLLSQSETTATPYSSLNNSLQDLADIGLMQSGGEAQKTNSMIYAPNPEQTQDNWRVGFSKGNVIQNNDPRTSYKENREAINKRYTDPKTATTKRAQSAVYYEAQHHKRMELEKYYRDIPPPRPKTATSRYRSWKPWLLEVYKEQEKAKELEEQNAERRKQNVLAFKKWLKKKQAAEDSSEYSSDSDEDDSFNTYRHYESKQESFQDWLKRKKPMLDKMDKKFREQQKLKRVPESRRTSSNSNDSRITIFEIGSTDAGQPKIDNSDTYIYAYQKWLRRKEKYEHWKRAKGLEQEDYSKITKKQLEEQKHKLYLSGFTYNEWLGHKYRENKVRSSKHKSKTNQMGNRKMIET